MHAEGKPGSTPGVTSRLAALSEESGAGSKFFDKVPLPEGAAAVAGSGAARQAGAAAGAEAASASAAAPSTPLSRAISVIGNGLFFGGVATASYFGYYYYRYDADELERMVEETRTKPENAFPGSGLWVPAMEWFVEQRRSVEGEMKKYADPPSEKLLPDLPPQARHVKTLVLDLDDLLVHSHWTRERGWRTFKRPGAEAFIADMAQHYELVLYTDSVFSYVDPIMDRLDPQRLIQYRLYRDSTQYVHGQHMRDLAKLNRDPRQVLYLSTRKDGARANTLQPENTLFLRPWKLESGDTTLLDMLPLLEQIVRSSIPVTDVRDVVKTYQDEPDIPAAYRERVRLAEEQRAQRTKAGRGFFGGLAK
ncbi:hypothetical protein QBZ16_000248 [Prototheca wickerhamii]|uniref:Mitochondrial import inner membrane translocase subunit TIM50 n=1 Tax=Prototheca wickerhamii TaxID=3111 RepID=A0AAD9IMW7_PROWI|nr:hypothetical protein QBZ16_000248 [Prototheca wickerhamii]